MLSKEWIDGTKFWLNLQILFLSASIAGLGQKSNTLLQAPAQENLPYLNNLKKNEDLHLSKKLTEYNKQWGPEKSRIRGQMGTQF